MKLLVLNNLASGYGEGAIYDFVRSFAADGDEVCLRSTDGTTELESLITDARDFDAVIASGGDGTVTTTAYSLAGTGIPVMPFPAGTANLLALNLAAPNEPHALAKMLRAGITLDFDMAEIEFRADDGESAKKGFGIMAGAGYDAMIYFTQYLGYRKYILRQLADYEFWYAEYEAQPRIVFHFDMWQYSSTGSVDGIEGDVDLNIYFRKS